MARKPAQRCQHGYCGGVSRKRLPEKSWTARELVRVGTHTVLVCESCRGPVVTLFRQNGSEPTVERIAAPAT